MKKYEFYKPYEIKIKIKKKPASQPAEPTFDPDHIDPYKPENRLERDPRDRLLLGLELLQAKLRKLKPIIQKEVPLTHAQQASKQRKRSQPMLALGRELVGVRIQNVHERLQTRYVDLVLHRAYNRHEDLHEEASERVLYISVFDIDKVLRAIVEELKRGLEVLDGHHFDAEVFHAHEKLYCVGACGRNELLLLLLTTQRVYVHIRGGQRLRLAACAV